MFEFKTLNFFETVKHVSHRDCEASGFGGTQNPAGHSLKQPALGDPALSKRVGEDSLQKHLPAWMILWFLSQFSNKSKVHGKFCAVWIAQYPVRSLVPRMFYSIFYSYRQWKSECRAHCPQRFSIASCHVNAGEELWKTIMPLKGKWLDVLQDLNPNFLTGWPSFLYVTVSYLPPCSSALSSKIPVYFEVFCNFCFDGVMFSAATPVSSRPQTPWCDHKQGNSHGCSCWEGRYVCSWYTPFCSHSQQRCPRTEHTWKLQVP